MRHQNCRLRLTVRTSPFQGGNTGSIPVADTKTCRCIPIGLEDRDLKSFDGKHSVCGFESHHRHQYLPIAEMEQQESSKLRWCKTPYVGSSPTGQTCYQ